MGHFAEVCADQFAFSRAQQDQYAAESVRRSVAAIESGTFKDEITPVEVQNKRGTVLVSEDEQPYKCDLEKIPLLKPAFRKEGGRVTAANSSSLSDGAAALLLMQAGEVKRLRITPLARILGHTTYAQTPGEFTTAPIGAIRKLYQKLGWTDREVDLYEINEAFAVVAMAAIRELKLDLAKVNVHGGGCALGHPIGATGARILVTLVHTLRQRGLKRGIASLCIGGGEATALAIERS
jgi:acetyl-CoA C-acetyltransferase